MLNSFKKVLTGSLLLSVILTGCGTTNSTALIAPNTVTPAVSEDASASASKYKVIEILGIGETYAKKLNDQGIKYTTELLAAIAKRSDRLKFAEKTGISAKLLLEWGHHIDLMKIKGIGPIQSNWLSAVGVASIKELAQRNIDNLYERLRVANTINPKKPFVDRMPSSTTVKSWIDTAKTTTPTVQE